ncbi:RNA polymerase I associated factor A49-like protein [Stereum hirsutum FP-91666 SS1]|uniref:RNA polymerase I associated factor A49-like protein n=1 Tax=Stereum hirsutum (strain FP-91666) TaxID=721885 RepID=UPI000444A3EF|nr:RNA polymerase I associated factor A49-like protein [Stereum hirsutum FP-91666 SS1]EIM84421.1 RNA polymerase I associated factor A49-like protein [Stereum hirsutum FP-91666 SS1]
MAPDARTKKRKRSDSDATASDGKKLILEPSSIPSTQVGPVLVSFPALQPPKETSFKCYVHEGEDGKEFYRQNITLAGETDSVEFEGANATRDGALGSRYYIALHRPSSSKVTLQPAPLHILGHTVKRLKSLSSASSSTGPSQSERIMARNALGQAFGTKKALAQIRANERNKVDVSAMESVAPVLQSGIERGTENLPTMEEAKSAADMARLIPRYDAEATSPEEAYPLHGIIPEQEWSALDGVWSSIKTIKAKEKETGERNVPEWNKMWPVQRSTWVKQHVNKAFGVMKPAQQKRVVKLLFYIAAMMSFRIQTSRGKVPDREVLLDRMSPAPETIVDGLLERFTEQARAATTRQATSSTQTNLLSHMLALCLKVDNFASEPTLIAADLQMAANTVNSIFRSLGCKIETLDAADLTKYGIAPSAVGEKRAILKTPLVFPKPRNNKRRN